VFSVVKAFAVQAKGLSGNNCIILAADASRLAALLVGHMRPACSILAPCDPGASTPTVANVIPDRALTFGRIQNPRGAIERGREPL
jgi:hypothetical protein